MSELPVPKDPATTAIEKGIEEAADVAKHYLDKLVAGGLEEGGGILQTDHRRVERFDMFPGAARTFFFGPLCPWNRRWSRQRRLGRIRTGCVQDASRTGTL
jgi:hypothetical protein